jgi:hypothetical protein
MRILLISHIRRSTFKHALIFLLPFDENWACLQVNLLKYCSRGIGIKNNNKLFFVSCSCLAEADTGWISLIAGLKFKNALEIITTYSLCTSLHSVCVPINEEDVGDRISAIIRRMV